MIHTKNIDFISSYIREKNEDSFKETIVANFNELFRKNNVVKQLTGNEERCPFIFTILQ